MARQKEEFHLPNIQRQQKALPPELQLHLKSKQKLDLAKHLNFFK